MAHSCQHSQKGNKIYAPIYEDRQVDSPEFPPKLQAVQLESRDKLLNGILFQAAGKGSHPTILLLHGFPGYENNFDLAHILMRSGWNVLIFHYRGAWGSPGRFTFSNAIEDSFAALEFLRDPDHSRQYHVDTSKIVPIGHSMGGFLALYLAAKDDSLSAAASIAGFNFGAHAKMIRDDPQSREETIRSFEDSLPPLNSPGADHLVNEYIQKGEIWNLERLIPPLENSSFLLLAGSRDEVAPPFLHHTPLVEKIETGGKAHLQSQRFETSHGFTNKRIALAQKILDWIQTVDAK